MSKRVKIYTTPTCSYCKMARSFFKKNNIEYREFDVSENLEAAREMVEKSGQYGVPVIDIDGKIIVGFDQKAIEKALKTEDEPSARLNSGMPSCCC